MPAGYNITWSAYVQHVLKKHGATLRSQRIRTGLAHTTVSSWMAGVTPGLEGVIAFAKGFGEDEAEAIQLAGYDPLALTDDILALARQIIATNEARTELAYEPDLSESSGAAFVGEEGLSPEDLEEARKAYLAILAEYHRKQGRTPTE